MPIAFADGLSLPAGLGVGLLAFIFPVPFVIASVFFASRKLRHIRRNRMQDEESQETEDRKG